MVDKGKIIEGKIIILPKLPKTEELEYHAKFS